MKAYILTIIITAVLSALTTYMSPKGWEKYIKLICGLVIISSLVMPVMRLAKSDIKLSIPDNSSAVSEYENLHNELVLEELNKRICDDIKARMKNEFGEEVEVSVRIDINENNEIERVTDIEIISGHINDAAKRRLYEVYGAEVVE